MQRCYASSELEPLRGTGEIKFITAEKGYGVFATREISPGEVCVEREAPVVASLRPGSVGNTRCSRCFCRCEESSFLCICGIRYCSHACQEIEATAHSYLCVGKVDREEHPLMLFKLHALATNEMFLSAAKAICMEIANPSQMANKFRNLQTCEWAYSVAFPPGHGDEKEMRQAMVELCHQLEGELRMALEQSLLTKNNNTLLLDHVCSKLSLWMGCFEQNQFEVCVGDDDEPCGTAIFSICCSLNHDCEPNAELVFAEDDNRASVVALRKIMPGEEITLNYLEPKLSLDERRAELLDYGFVCRCNRCRQEELWIQEQQRLAALVVTERHNLASINRIGGFDISFPEDDENETSIACLCICSYPDLELLHSELLEVEIQEMYIPGFLAFREAAVCDQMLRQCPSNMRPDILLLDGCGIQHPRRCGLASHVGVLCDIPTIGVSKKLYQVDGLDRDSIKKSVSTMLKKSSSRELPLRGDSGVVWGKAFVPPSASNPIFVSIGHRVDLDLAMEVVQQSCRDTRVPAPTRLADLKSRQAIRKRKER